MVVLLLATASSPAAAASVDHLPMSDCHCYQKLSLPLKTKNRTTGTPVGVLFDAQHRFWEAEASSNFMTTNSRYHHSRSRTSEPVANPISPPPNRPSHVPRIQPAGPPTSWRTAVHAYVTTCSRSTTKRARHPSSARDPEFIDLPEGLSTFSPTTLSTGIATQTA